MFPPCVEPSWPLAVLAVATVLLAWWGLLALGLVAIQFLRGLVGAASQRSARRPATRAAAPAHEVEQ